LTMLLAALAAGPACGRRLLASIRYWTLTIVIQMPSTNGALPGP